MENDFYKYPYLYDNIIPVTALILVFAVFFFLIYYFIYRFYINRKILKGDRKARPLLVSPAVIGITVFVILSIAAYYTTQFRLNTVYKGVCDVYSSSASQTHLLMEERQQYATSRIAKHATFTAGKNHPETKTFDLELTIETDIVLGKNDKLTFRIGDSKSELKKDKDGNYGCTVQASVLQNSHQGILTLESDGDRISEILSDEDPIFYDSENPVRLSDQIGDYIDESLPYFESSEANVKITDKNDNTSDISTDITVTAYPVKTDKNSKFTEMKLVLEQNGKVLGETDLLNSKDVKKNGNEYTYTFKGSVKKGQEASCYVLAKDKSGFSYKLYCRLSDEIFYNESENIIYDLDGNEAVRYDDLY